MTRNLSAIALAAALMATGCTEETLNREAGAFLDMNSFGNATMNNTQIHSGERNYTLELAQRFANEVPSTVNFAFGSAQLDGQARQILTQQAHWISQFPEVRFRVFGHTDAVGTNASNMRLGKRRARAVVAFLGQLGIGRDRLEAVVSHGENQPLIVTQGRERQNRRTVTEVSGFVKRHTGPLDGKYAAIVYREYVKSAAPVSTLTGVDNGTGG